MNIKFENIPVVAEIDMPEISGAFSEMGFEDQAIVLNGSVDRMFWECCRYCGKRRRSDIKYE